MKRNATRTSTTCNISTPVCIVLDKRMPMARQPWPPATKVLRHPKCDFRFLTPIAAFRSKVDCRMRSMTPTTKFHMAIMETIIASGALQKKYLHCARQWLQLNCDTNSIYLFSTHDFVYHRISHLSGWSRKHPGSWFWWHWSSPTGTSHGETNCLKQKHQTNHARFHCGARNTKKNNGPVVRQDVPEMLPGDVMFYFLWFWRCFCVFFICLCHVISCLFFKFWAKFPWHHSFAHVARGYSEMHLFKCWW